MTKHEAVLWRRDKVQELLIKGYNQLGLQKSFKYQPMQSLTTLNN